MFSRNNASRSGARSIAPLGKKEDFPAHPLNGQGDKVTLAAGEADTTYGAESFKGLNVTIRKSITACPGFLTGLTDRMYSPALERSATPIVRLMKLVKAPVSTTVLVKCCSPTLKTYSLPPLPLPHAWRISILYRPGWFN